MELRSGSGRWPVLFGGLFAATLAIAPAAFADPPKARLTFAPGGHIRIPFDAARQHVWIRGRVNGSDSVWIVVDSGASGSVLDLGLARGIRLDLEESRHQAGGAGGTTKLWLAKNVTLELPGLSIQRPEIGVIDNSSTNAVSGRPMQVILGSELFDACVVRFDYTAGMMDVWDKKQAPKSLAGTAVPMTLRNNHPYIRATVALPGRPPLSGDFVIDTGSAAALILDQDIVRRDSLIAALPRTLMLISRGTGGEIRNRVGRATSFAIGDLSFAQPTVVLPESVGGRFNVPGTIGNIGAQILNRCAVTFDYSNMKVYFEKGPDFARAYEADMSGASLSRVPNGYVVRDVAPDSPASEAGVALGDVITAVDGATTKTMDPYQIRQLLQREGREVTLEVAHGTETKQLKLTLRRLI